MGDFHDIIGSIGIAVDVVGVLVILAGVIVACARMVGFRPRDSRTGGGGDGVGPRDRFEAFRQDLARAILLGLEFLIAGDIIRTVAVTPTLSSVALLGLIVLVRTFLSITLHLEVEGRWPWQKADPPANRA